MAHRIAACELIERQPFSGKAIDQAQLRHGEARRHDLVLRLDAVRINSNLGQHDVKWVELVRVGVLVYWSFEQSKVIEQLGQLPRHRWSLNGAHEGKVPVTDDIAWVREYVDFSSHAIQDFSQWPGHDLVAVTTGPIVQQHRIPGLQRGHVEVFDSRIRLGKSK